MPPLSRLFFVIAGCLGLLAASAGSFPATGLSAQAAPLAPSIAQGLNTPERSAPAAQSGAAASPERALLDRYCVTCHNDRLKTAGFTLQSLRLEQAGSNASVWEKVVRKLRAGAMPPVGAPRPEKAALDALVSNLETTLDVAAAAAPDVGRPPIHRLSRTEYANAIRDLLALDVDVSELLPPDGTAHGFDNIAELLSVSPALLERYLSAARRVGALAIGNPAMRPVFESYEVSRFLRQDSERMSEDLPFGSRGGIAITHQFPLDGEYVALVTFSSQQPELEVRLDGTRLAVLTPPPPPPTQYGGDIPQPKPQEVRFSAKAGKRTLGLSFVDRNVAVEGTGAARVVKFGMLNEGVIRVDIGGPYKATGVGDTPSRRRIFVCQPTSERNAAACARKVLTTLARRAYRRPATDEDVRLLLDFYTAARRDGEGFDAGIQRALEPLLVSPDFLFRIEREPADAASGPRRITDLDLASRLSFFLWSTIPDDELLDLAERGRLNRPAVLEQQVRRMLADKRADTLATNFATQWLYLRDLRSFSPDPRQFPEFDDNLKEAMRRETELFIDSQIREDHPLAELLSANYTFLNERLARHYGIPDVYGSHFRRVTLTDERRSGLLGQGSILAVTSYPHRTSVVQRGKWVLENILGTPPPAPPANVPALEENSDKVQPKSLRERMEQHRKNASCATCHARIDPVGFALENFDAVGAWRAKDAGVPIDASGTLPDGTRLNGPNELRRALIHSDQYLTTTTERLLTYAIGRGVEYYDQPAVRKILREAAPHDFRWSAIILGIVNSAPFQMRMPEPVKGPTSVADRRAHQ